MGRMCHCTPRKENCKLAVRPMLTCSLASSKFVLGYAAPEVEFRLGGMECQIDRRSSKEE